jgi:hypothetical protein
MAVTAMKYPFDTMATDDDTETSQWGSDKLIPGLILLGLVFMTLLHADQIFTGMGSTRHHTVAGDERSGYFRHCDERPRCLVLRNTTVKSADESQEERRT